MEQYSSNPAPNPSKRDGLPAPTPEEQHLFRRAWEAEEKLPQEERESTARWFREDYSLDAIESRRLAEEARMGGAHWPPKGWKLHRTAPRNEVLRGLGEAMRDQLHHGRPWRRPAIERLAWASRVVWVARAVTDPDFLIDGVQMDEGFERDGDPPRVPRWLLWSARAENEGFRTDWNRLLEQALEEIERDAVAPTLSARPPSRPRVKNAAVASGVYSARQNDEATYSTLPSYGGPVALSLDALVGAREGKSRREVRREGEGVSTQVEHHGPMPIDFDARLAGPPGASAPGGPPRGWDERDKLAVAWLLDHPSASDADVASGTGIRRQAFYEKGRDGNPRLPRFTTARKALRAAPTNIPHGGLADGAQESFGIPCSRCGVTTRQPYTMPTGRELCGECERAG